MATDNKYDRQLRLWGADGQRRLAESHVLLINATPAGTEALKNLILPGIGKFTIADTHLVSTADRGNNFFVTEESIGKPRAEATRELLGELNSDTVACAMHGADASTFAKDPDKLKPFNLIMCCDLTEQEIVGLAKACSLLGKPLIISETMGLLGYVRVYKPEHCVVESKPVDEVESDLRLHKPFAEFVDFAAKFNLEYLDEIHHKHVPFPIILLKAKDMWKSTHAGKLPANFAEKKEFSEMIKKMAHDFTSEDNFIEAVAHVPKCFLLDDVKPRIKMIIEDPKCEDKKCAEKFWVLAAALKRFNARYKELPLSGKIPDLTADTESYLALQKIYQDKAKKHCEMFREELTTVVKERGLSGDFVTIQEADHFCLHNWEILCVRYKSIDKEYLEGPESDTVQSEINDPSSLIAWYFLLRASLRYQTKYGTFPAEKAAHDKYLEELPAFKETVAEIVHQSLGKDTKFAVDENMTKEMMRYSNSKIHNIGAIVGGVVAQEAIKFITQIFSPMSNTLIFEGAQSKLGVFAL